MIGRSRAFAAAVDVDEARIVRFRADDGEEYFGVFADAQETRARIARRSETTGRLAITSEVRGVDIILPPVDPPQIFCVGLNYADHAAEVKMDAPKVRA